MIELTEEQRKELREAEPSAIDPGTNETYVLVRKSVYDRLKGLLDDEWTVDELRLVLAHSAEANGWNEPGMDDYDNYDAHRANSCN